MLQGYGNGTQLPVDLQGYCGTEYILVQGYGSGKATGWICHVDPVHRLHIVSRVPATARLKIIQYQGHAAA